MRICTGPLNVRMTGQIKISIPECKDSWRVLINEIQSWHGAPKMSHLNFYAKEILFREMYPIKIFTFMNPDNLLRSPSRSWRRIRNSDGKEAEADRYKDHHHHQGDVEIVRLGIGA